MSFIQLATNVPVSVEGRGNGYAFGVIDYGQEHNLIWVVALDESGEIWCSPNPLVRVRGSWAADRASSPEIVKTPNAGAALVLRPIGE